MFFDRKSTRQRRAPAQTHVYPGPVRGWIRNETLAGGAPGGAEVLDNFFPTPEGARVRRGSSKHATIGASVTALLTYDTGGTRKVFAADASALYDVTTPADPDVAVTASISGLNGGDWSAVQFATSGGDFLVAVNGTDDQHLYDGSEWWEIDTTATEELAYDAETGAFTAGLVVTGGTSGATATIYRVDDNGTDGTLYIKGRSGTFQDNETITDTSTGSATSDIPSGLVVKYAALTGVNTAALSHVWAFKKRLFYIEDGTLSAWYLGTLAITGTATEFPLKGLFSKGGDLLFGTTWSRDAGDGIDDFCLFVTTEGEVAVYQGTDPASFALVGVFQIGKPLGKNAWFRTGGDVVVVTDDGIIPMSQAVTRDRNGLGQVALTFPIEEAWRDLIDARKGTGTFSVRLWHDRAQLLVGLPTPTGEEKVVLVANARTGAWARYTGWDVQCMAVLNDELYFGTGSSAVVKGETGGDDQDATYSAVWVPRFDMLGTPGEKAAIHARFMGRKIYSVTPQLFANADFEVNVPTPLPADADITTNTWGSGTWGTSVWGGSSNKSTLSRWEAVAAVGQSLAPGLSLTTGRNVEPDVEVVSLQLRYEIGEVMG